MRKVQSSFDKVLEEHRELRGMADDLERFLEQPQPPTGEKGAQSWAGTLAEKLVRFHDKLFRHFREEERSGFLDDLAQAIPRASRTIEVLREDHGRILADLRSALEGALCYASRDDEQTHSLRDWTRSILENLVRHEQEETDLMQAMLNDDLGTGD